MLRAESYRRKLDGSALEETTLLPNELRRMQRRLVDLKFLSGNIDGVFGSETRLAIRSFQTSIGHPQANFLTADERNVLLAPAGTATRRLTQTSVPAQTSISTQTPMSVPESSPEVPSPQPSTGQGNQNAAQTLTQTSVPAQTSISTKTPMSVSQSSPEVPLAQPSAGQENHQNLESGLSDMNETMLASGQLVQPGLLEAVNPSTEPEVTEEADGPTKKLVEKPQPSYFTQAVLLLLITILVCMGIILLMGVFLLMTLYYGQVREVDDATPVMPVPNDLSGAPEPNQISTPNSQVVAPILVPSVG
jgi:hypothetical protein